MEYYIHPSHKDHGDRENLPHVHICFGDHSDKSRQVTVSLTNCTAIITGDNTTYHNQKQAEDFVRQNLSRLIDEWNSKSGNDW